MAINPSNRQAEKRRDHSLSPCHLATLSPCLLLLLLFTSCASVRPIVKIGLIASFEGLYRRNGYEALDAMRAAIADLPDSPALAVDLLPLALDDSVDAQRTAQKMLVDSSVRGVIGPLTPQGVAFVAQEIATSKVRWVAPFAVNPTGGFANPQSESAWATELIRHMAQSIDPQSGTKLFLAGWPAGLPTLSAQEWRALTNIETELLDPSTLQKDGLNQRVNDTDLFFWLGNAEEGARVINELWAAHPTMIVWSGPQGGDPVFAERLTRTGSFYWITWSDNKYEEWATTHNPSTPAAYLTYVATRTVIAQLQLASLETTSSQTDLFAQPVWSVLCFRLNGDSTSSQLNDCMLRTASKRLPGRVRRDTFSSLRAFPEEDRLNSYELGF